jgi:hypothetical protein
MTPAGFYASLPFIDREVAADDLSRKRFSE